jgi:hypothetical protein
MPPSSHVPEINHSHVQLVINLFQFTLLNKLVPLKLTLPGPFCLGFAILLTRIPAAACLLVPVFQYEIRSVHSPPCHWSNSSKRLKHFTTLTKNHPIIPLTFMTKAKLLVQWLGGPFNLALRYLTILSYISSHPHSALQECTIACHMASQVSTFSDTWMTPSHVTSIFSDKPAPPCFANAISLCLTHRVDF